MLNVYVIICELVYYVEFINVLKYMLNVCYVLYVNLYTMLNLLCTVLLYIIMYFIAFRII